MTTATLPAQKGQASSEQRTWRLSPSDLTFGWEDCRRCFYQKIVLGVRRPSGPMPSVFNRIDAAMKTCFMGTSTDGVGLVGGTFRYADKTVLSRPLVLPDTDSRIVLGGRFDTAITFGDDTAAMSDFKTSSPKDAHVGFYSRQLHAYALACEQPADGKFALANINRLGLLIFDPQEFVHRPEGNKHTAYFGGSLDWLEIERNDEQFLAFLAEVVLLLERPTAPEAASKCPYCAYVKNPLLVSVVAPAIKINSNGKAN